MEIKELPGWAGSDEELITSNEYRDAIKEVSEYQYIQIKAVWDRGNAWRSFKSLKNGKWSEEDRYGMISQQHVDVVVSGDSYFQPDGPGGACSHDKFEKRIPMAICFWDWHDNED
jgi:hypothetical protein